MSACKKVSSMAPPCSSGNADEQLLVAGWDPLQSVDNSVKFGGTNGMSSYIVGNSNSAAIERVPNFPCFGSESLSEIMSSFTLPESVPCSQDFPSTNELSTEQNLRGKKRKQLPDHGAMRSNSPMNVEAEQQKDVPIETVKNLMEKYEKKQKSGLNSGVKENGESNKEDYIHIRAKRGQATNSHSLAERVRREKISERMKLLQDIVPGCNKITGKALMLDEIINYVQSLQRQVEGMTLYKAEWKKRIQTADRKFGITALLLIRNFLSMKLATVKPEINMDVEQIFTKENLQSVRYGISSVFGYGPEMGTSHPHLQQAEIAMPCIPNSRDLLRTINTHTSMPQISSSWDQEIQNAFQMGFISNVHVNGLELNGSMKAEL